MTFTFYALILRNSYSCKYQYFILISLSKKVLNLKNRISGWVRFSRSYSDPYFPASGPNTERYFVSLRIQSKCGKMWTRITPNTDTFHAMDSYLFWFSLKLDISQRIRNLLCKKAKSIFQKYNTHILLNNTDGTRGCKTTELKVFCNAEPLKPKLRLS